MKVVFLSSNRWGARLIRWFTESKWSHCAIILDDDLEGDALVFESAIAGGVKLNLWSKLQRHLHEIYEINQTCCIKPIYAYLGENYGYFQILGYPIAKLIGSKDNPIKKDYVCSEIVLRFLLENDFTEFDHLEPDMASPQDLYDIISQSENFQKA